MDLNNLAIFVAVVEQGSLTGAARVLQIPKSKISRRLMQFEQQQAAPLLVRSTRKLQLTDIGRALFNRSQPLLSELNAVDREFNAHQFNAEGLLKILIPVDFFPNQFTDICAEFLRQYPQVSLTVSHYSGHYPETDSAGMSDSLVFVLHQGVLPDSDFNAKPLMSLSQSLYCSHYKYPQEHLLTHDLSEQDCLLTPGESTWLFQAGAHLEAVRVKGRLSVPNKKMLIDACVSGLGIAKLTDIDVESQQRKGALIRLQTDLAVEALSLTLLYRSQFLPQRMRLFIDFFQSNIGRLSSLVG